MDHEEEESNASLNNDRNHGQSKCCLSYVLNASTLRILIASRKESIHVLHATKGALSDGQRKRRRNTTKRKYAKSPAKRKDKGKQLSSNPVSLDHCFDKTLNEHSARKIPSIVAHLLLLHPSRKV
jgi:hypothetical protein